MRHRPILLALALALPMHEADGSWKVSGYFIN